MFYYVPVLYIFHFSFKSVPEDVQLLGPYLGSSEFILCFSKPPIFYCLEILTVINGKDSLWSAYAMLIGIMKLMMCFEITSLAGGFLLFSFLLTVCC